MQPAAGRRCAGWSKLALLMKALRHLGFVLWLALALVAGQQLVLLHDLGHAAESLAQKQDSKPAPSKCDQHYATSQLTGSTPAGLVVPLECGDSFALGATAIAHHAQRFSAYLSRGPPTLL
jgi:hypothetical protein